MAFGLSDKITIDKSENYIMSIRLRSDGLSFSVYNPSEKDSFLYKEVSFERGRNYISSLKEIFFENEFFSWHYKKVNVICASYPYTIIPKELFQEKYKTEILTFTTSAVEKHCLSNVLTNEHAELVFGIEDEVYEFCSRSLVNPYFVHHITPILPLLRKLSCNSLSKQLFVNLHRQSIDIIGYAQGSLIFINSFEYKQTEDIVYYVLYVWKQMGMSQQSDQLSLLGDPSACQDLNKILKDYIQYIKLLGMPSEAYLLGTDVMQTPLDVIALSLCEL